MSLRLRRFRALGFSACSNRIRTVPGGSERSIRFARGTRLTSVNATIFNFRQRGTRFERGACSFAARGAIPIRPRRTLARFWVVCAKRRFLRRATSERMCRISLWHARPGGTRLRACGAGSILPDPAPSPGSPPNADARTRPRPASRPSARRPRTARSRFASRWPAGYRRSLPAAHPPAVRWKFLGEPDLVSPASPLPGDCGLMLPIGKGSPHGGRTRASRGRTNVSRETTSRRAQSCSKRVNGPPLRGEGFSVIDDCRFLPVSGFERDRRSGRVPPSALCLPSRPISKLSCALRCRVSSACGLRKASSSAHLALGCANCGNGFQIIS